MVEFGNRLRQLRRECHLTQKQLAAQIGVQNSIISFYENGDRIPSPEVLIRLSCALHVSADYLMGIEKAETLDISGLTGEDRAFVRQTVEFLRAKNKGTGAQRDLSR